VVGQIKGEFEVNEPLLQRYYHMVSNLIARFKKVTVEHIHREDNTRADALSRLATTKKKSHHKFVVQIHLKNPSVGEAECLAVIEVDTWMNPIIQYLELGTCKPEVEKTMRQQSARYTMIGQDLYKRGYFRPLLKCIIKEQTKYALQEIHEDACVNHSDERTMVTKVFRVGYYWPIIHSDSIDYVKKCTKC